MTHSINSKRTRVVQIFSQYLSLSPVTATILFVIGCLAGYRYRRVWKAEGPRWQLWVTGMIAAASFLILGFVPMNVPG